MPCIVGEVSIRGIDPSPSPGKYSIANTHIVLSLRLDHALDNEQIFSSLRISVPKCIPFVTVNGCVVVYWVLQGTIRVGGDRGDKFS